MRQSQFAISILASILLTLAGCGDDEGDGTRGTDAGEQIADAGEGPAEDAGAADAGQQTEDAGQLVGDAGVAASVEWITEPEPLTIDTDIGVDFAYQYELVLPDGDLSYSLSLERCSHMAGEEEVCSDESRSNLPGTGYVRWGIDPSQYAVGENRYRFHLTLTQGATLIDEDTIELVANVTSCAECGPGSGGE